MADTTRNGVARERVPVSVLPGLADWMGNNMGVGGMFATPGHALELALDRLRQEHDHVRQVCRQGKAPFRAAAFWSLYKEEVAQAQASGRWRLAPHAAVRTKVYGAVAIELLDWSKQARLEGAPLETLSQFIEVGLRRLQVSRFCPPGADPRPTLTPEELWRQYQKAADPKAG